VGLRWINITPKGQISKLTHKSHIAHRTSRIAHRTLIAHRISHIAHRTSHIAHRTSHIARSSHAHRTLIAHRTSHIAHRTSHIAHRTSHIAHRTSHIAHRTSHTDLLIGVKCTPTNVIMRFVFVFTDGKAPCTETSTTTIVHLPGYSVFTATQRRTCFKICYKLSAFSIWASCNDEVF
jgi:hypothetical protein